VAFRGEAKVHTKLLAERSLMAIGLGAILGARLVDVFFYQDVSSWWNNPLSIFFVWEGGLASHGGAIGIIIALFILVRRLRREKMGFYSFLSLLDRIVPGVALAGACIRIGNFINQEVLGTPTDLPWAVLFLHPADGSLIVPRHPVQLYESLAYIILSGLLYALWTKKPHFRREGVSSGLFLTIVFGFRFLIEFVKVEQSDYILLSSMTMGQFLSLPFLAFGIYLLWRLRKTPNRQMV